MRKKFASYRCCFLDVRPNFTQESYGTLKTVGPAFFLPVGKQGRKCDFQVVQCACNGEHYVKRVDDLKSGRIVSCGCARVIHGCWDKPEKGYKCWESMLHRCRYTDTRSCRNHGGRGIRVCDRWQEPNGQGFLNFQSDMGPRPSLQHSIDRIDNDGHYCPENCRWATQKEQMNNTRRNIWIEHNGDRKNIAQWAELSGLDPSTLYSRIIIRKWDMEKALTTPTNYKKRTKHKKPFQRN